MNTNTQTQSALALRDAGALELTANGVQMRTVAEVGAFCALLGRANMLPKGTTPEGAVVAVLAGARLGLDPFQSVQGIASINGRPAIWGDALVAIVKGSGLVEDESVEYLPNKRECHGVRYSVKRKGIATPYEGTFTKADAERAGLWGKGVWQAYPARMLLNRARAFALRDGFADVLKGFRVAEEEQDVIDAEPKAEPKAKRASASSILKIAEVAEPVEVAEVAEPVEPVEVAEVATSDDFLPVD